MLLWFGPAAMLLGGGAVLIAVLRRRGRMNADQFERDDDEAIEPDSADAAAPRALGHG
jgi:cytochrome c-type biogenesis protein CcmH/NrfF